jgi:membrane protease YdiL (CAAX protease family)
MIAEYLNIVFWVSFSLTTIGGIFGGLIGERSNRTWTGYILGWCIGFIVTVLIVYTLEIK